MTTTPPYPGWRLAAKETKKTTQAAKPPKPTGGISGIVAPVLNGARALNLHGLTTKQVQKLLASRGYNIGVDGKMGPQTKAAIDAYTKGKPAKQYNAWAAKHFAAPSGGGIAGVGNVIRAAATITGAAAAGAAAGKPPKPPKNSGVLSMTGDLDPEVGSFLPESLAGQAAGYELDPQIHQTQRALDLLPGQRTQNLHDIGSWYDQVLGSQATAATRDKEIGAAGVGSIKDAVAGIIASLGGGANQGAGVVGGAGADALGMLGAEGAAQDQYNADIRPLLRSESAGASTRESARMSQQDRELRGTLSDLQGQRGAKRADLLLGIKGQNNTIAEQQFQNRLAIEQMRQAGAVAAGKLLASGTKAPKGSYAATSPTQKLGIMQTAVQTIVDENGKLKVDIPHAVQLVNNIVAGAGWDRSNPAVKAFRNQILQSAGISPQAGWT